MSDWTDLIRQLELLRDARWHVHTVKGSGGEDWQTIRIEIRRKLSDFSHAEVEGGR